MTKKLVFAFLLVIFLAQFAVSPVFAASAPVGGCPTGFTLEAAMVHDIMHHKHAGTAADQNGDGYTCMKPVTPLGQIHVHIDNALP
jgi:hypothetical protein